jgi:hypothetical protein
MPGTHTPPANIKDFDRGANPTLLYQKWDAWIGQQVAPSADYAAWYESTNPPQNGNPQTAAPPWQGLPHTALLLNNKDVLAAAKAVDSPVEYGTGVDALLVNQPDFLTATGARFPGLKYRPHDEYLEWVTLRDPDGVVREVCFTCEGPEYWGLIAKYDQALLVTLYGEITGKGPAGIDPTKLYFSEPLTHVEPFAGNQKLTFKAGDYNPYNEYNIAAAVHLTQGANTLGAEIKLAMDGSLIWGSPAKDKDPDLVCCAAYGEPNRFSDPTIGNEVNTLARQNMFVTLRDPLGLYIQTILPNDFTDWNDQPIANLKTDYFVPLRQSGDKSMTLRAKFKVPDGVMRNGKQARVGDLKYKGVPISMGGQIADAITMNLFAQALPGAPQQVSQKCYGHPCFDSNHPGFVLLTKVGIPCQAPKAEMFAHMLTVRPKTVPQTRATFRRLAHYS